MANNSVLKRGIRQKIEKVSSNVVKCMCISEERPEAYFSK